MFNGDLLECLVACVKKAYELSGYDSSPDSDIYWHTRELCVGVALENGVRISIFIECVNKYDHDYERVITRNDLWTRIWPVVAHPSMIIKDVMDS